MNKCQCQCSDVTTGTTENASNHINAFVDASGVPYVLAEYLDSRPYQQIDRESIHSDITIDTSDVMRAVIDINVDVIGKHCDGRPSVRGNNTKQKDLLKMIMDHRNRFDNQLPVLRRGIIMRVNYRIENPKTRVCVRSATEDFRIMDRNYFLEINPNDINDNAVITNFSGSAVSAVNGFTDGRTQLLFRVTSIQMFYEGCKAPSITPRVKPTLSKYPDELPTSYGDSLDYYRYHDQMQPKQFIGTPGVIYGNEPKELICAPEWSAFNRFYHFDNHRRDIVFHYQEINDPRCDTFLVPCGTVTVNRTFAINPGVRIIFKFSVWRNDVTIVGDTSVIADTLKVPDMDMFTTSDSSCNCNNSTAETNPDYESVLRILDKNQEMICKQNHVINTLVKQVEALQSRLETTCLPDIIDPEDPLKPGESADIIVDGVCACGCGCKPSQTKPEDPSEDDTSDTSSGGREPDNSPITGHPEPDESTTDDGPSTDTDPDENPSE